MAEWPLTLWRWAGNEWIDGSLPANLRGQVNLEVESVVPESDLVSARAERDAVRAVRKLLWNEVHRVGGPRKSELVKIGRELDKALERSPDG